MDRLFLPIYARLLAAMVAATLAIYVFVVPKIEARVKRNFVAALTPTLSLLAEQIDRELRASPERSPEILRDATDRFEVPCRIVFMSALELEDRERASLERGEIVARGHLPDIILFAPIGNAERVLKWGPLAPNNPIGGERG